MEREYVPIYSAATTPEDTQSKTQSAKKPGWIKWTANDRKVFEEAHKFYGNKWKKISEYMGNKTNKAVRSFYRRVYENQEKNQKTKCSCGRNVSRIGSDTISEYKEHLTPKEKQRKNKDISKKRSSRKKKCLEKNEERPPVEEPQADFMGRNHNSYSCDLKAQKSDEEEQD